MRKYAIVLLGIVGCLGTSCSKDALNDQNGNASAPDVQAQLQVHNTTEALDKLLAVMFIDDQYGNVQKTAEGCSEIIYGANSITISYSNCIINKNILNGTLVMTPSGGEEGETTANFGIVFDNFSFNEFKLNGSKNFKIDISKAYHPVFTIVTQMEMKDIKGATLLHNGTVVQTWNLQKAAFDDADYTTTGSWNMVHNGVSYDFVVEKALEGKLKCADFVAGVLVLQQGEQKVSLDFGTGNCDSSGILKYGQDQSKNISW